MSSLFSALGTAASALDAMQQAMGVVQNNVANASTPGYVTQTLTLNARAFNPAQNSWGGVQAGGIQSSRNTFAESSVWAANEQVGYATQQSTSLASLQTAFDVTGANGIPSALSSLYSAFSAWSTSPGSATAQRQVLTAASGIAQAFNSTAASAAGVAAQVGQQTQSTVTQINQLTTQIASINEQIRNGGSQDAGLQAQLYTNLESLSNLVDITTQIQSDGTTSVLMGGQVSLVNGQTANALTVNAVNPPVVPPHQQIQSSAGADVTDKINAGQLGGLLQLTNTVLPSIIGDSTQQGSLNQLAQGLADRVNTLLKSGQNGANPPSAGVPLFSYTANASGPSTSVAGSLAVAPGMTASQLVAVDPGPPVVANGIADQLAQLQSSTNPGGIGSSFADFYSSIAANVGTLTAGAAQAKTSQTQVLTQAQAARGQLSGVSLNEQAAALLQYQNAYQASAQAIATIKNTIAFLMQALQ